MSHTLKFHKYHGLGNDFIIINNLDTIEPLLKSSEAVKVCNRNFGIGGDGVILVMKGQESCDYTMKIFNSDGTEPQMCGNGIRCFALYLHKLEDATFDIERSYRIWTKGGVIIATVLPNTHILVNMGRPRLTAAIVPSTLACTVDDKAIDSPLFLLDKPYLATAVGMGNPHAVSVCESISCHCLRSCQRIFQVVFVDTDPDTLTSPSFESLGPALESHISFPEKTNAEFVKVYHTSSSAHFIE
jgi:diaminopimelate epimerase